MINEKHLQLRLQQLDYMFYDLRPVDFSRYHFAEGEDITFKGKTVTIPADFLQCDLLHAMLEIHEHEISDTAKRGLVGKIHSELLDRLPDLDSRVMNYMLRDGGKHSLFFVLESIRLDREAGYDMGSVLGVT